MLAKEQARRKRSAAALEYIRHLRLSPETKTYFARGIFTWQDEVSESDKLASAERAAAVFDDEQSVVVRRRSQLITPKSTAV